ncbi:MAG: TrkA family potassium uptake protein, partial [Desulfovibrionaceae bacterium]
MSLVFCIGVIGLMWVEEWDFIDSVYMVVTTLSTVGYGEVHKLDTSGRILMMFVIMTGVGSFFYLAGVFVQLLVDGHIQNIFGRRWMQRTIGKMSGHIIICGYGRIGSIAAGEIMAEDQEVVVIEKDPAMVEELVRQRVLHVAGDATRDEVLEAAGIGRAKSLIAALTDESANVYVTLSARQLNPEIRIVARCNSLDHTQKLQRAGADQVLYPHLYGGLRMAQSVLRPTVVNFMDLATRGDCQDLQMEELVVAPDSMYAGKNLIESKLRQRFNVIVIAVKKP